MLWILAWLFLFVGLLTVGVGVSMILLPALETLPLTGLSCSALYEDFFFSLFYLAYSCFVLLSWRPAFSEKEVKG